MLPIKDPKPNIDHFIRVVKGLEKPNKVLNGELKVDDDLLKEICEEIFHRTWVNRQKSDLTKRAKYWDNVIHIFYHLGYDFVRVGRAITFPTKARITADTSDITDNDRVWVEEDEGAITDIESFNAYPWPDPNEVDLWDYEYVSNNLPKGMGMMIGPSQGILEIVTNSLLGFTGFSLMLYDNPELVEAVFEKTGDILYKIYQRVVETTKAYGFFQGDDMGYNSGLMFSDKLLRKSVLPWHQKLIKLAHSNDLIYILHSCGNLRKIGKDIIEMNVDVKHSFEENGYSVKSYKDDYGMDITIMGGVDVDRLSRYKKDDLIEYCNDILNHCMKNGRYIYGSGNSVTNYVSIENYFTMLETGMKFKQKEIK